MTSSFEIKSCIFCNFCKECRIYRSTLYLKILDAKKTIFELFKDMVLKVSFSDYKV